jgi:hypothetical protein
MSSLLKWYGQTLMFSGSDSGALAAGDRIRLTDSMYGPLSLCYSVQPPRGGFGTSNFNGLGIDRGGWVVNQSTVTNQRAGIGKLVIEWEAGGSAGYAALPSGGFSLKPQELNPKIERNPFFTGILYATIQLVYAALYAQTQTGSSTAYNTIQTIPDATQKALANKLLAKLLNGEETYYLAGWSYSYELYSYTLPTIAIGGITQTPGGPMAGDLPSGLSWLRLADDIEPAGVSGSMYKLTLNYLGGPNGHWDTDIYPPG